MLKRVLQLKLKLVGIIVLTLILIQLLTAYVFGFIAQSQMDMQFKQLTDSPFVKVIRRDYHRGLFSSDVTTELAINSNTISSLLKILPNGESQAAITQTYSLKYSTHIEHGLFSGVLNGYFAPTIAYAKTNLIYPDNLKNMLGKFFNKQQPLIIENIIYLDKSGKFNLTSPEFTYDEALSGVKVIWDGLSLSIRYNRDFDQFHNQLFIPRFELSAPTKGVIELHNLTYNSDTKDSINKIKVGQTNLALGSMKVEWKDKIALHFKLGDVLHMLTGISSTEFLNGIDAIDPSGFAFTNVSYASTSSDENNFFSASAEAKFQSLLSNGKTYGPMDLNLSINHILSVEFSQLIDKLEEISTTPAAADAEDKRKQELINTLKQYLGPILVAQPVIKLAKFELTTPNGLIKVSGSATTNDFKLTDLNDQQAFMKKLLLDFNFSVPKPVLAYLFVLQMKYLLSAGNAEMDQQSSDALAKVVNILLDNQVNTWTKKGYLANKNGLLESHILIRDGELSLNGMLRK
jgi:uncharacterized protein YdgA (DUF945 family)